MPTNKKNLKLDVAGLKQPSSFGVQRHEPIELVLDPRVVSEHPRQIADQVIGSRYIRVNRQDVEGTWRYLIRSNFDELIDFSQSMIYQRLRIVGLEDNGKTRPIPRPKVTTGTIADEHGKLKVDTDGTVMMAHKIEGECVSGCALLGIAMNKKIDVEMNGVKISEDTRGHIPFTCYVRALKEFCSTDTQGAMKSALFLPDIPGAQIDPITGAYICEAFGNQNTALQERYIPTASSRPFDLYTPLSMIDPLNFANKTRALPSGVEVLVSFEEGNGSLVLVSNTRGKNYKVEIVEMSLDIRMLKLNPSALSGYELSLNKSPFTARISIWDVEYSYVAAGETRTRKTFTGALPAYFHVVLMSQSQYHGNYQEQLHYFYHHNVRQLTVDYGDGQEPLSVDYNWESKLPDRAFWLHNHFENGAPYTGYTPASSFLTPDSFKTGFSIITVNTSRGHTYGKPLESSAKWGPIEFRWIFGREIPAGGIVMLYMMPKEKTLVINRERSVTVV